MQRPLSLLDPGAEREGPGEQGEAVPEERTLMVGGAPIKVDKFGPVVVNKDGSMSRIRNWHEMTENEQQSTLRVIGKRNQERLTLLRAAAADNESGG